jgi:hypothetical protein
VSNNYAYERGQGGVELNCAGVANAFNIKKVSDISISGITIRNCSGISGGAISLTRSELILNRVNLTENRAENGGAVYVAENSQLKMYRVTCEGNSARLGGCVSLSASKVIIGEGTVIKCNKADYGLGDDIYCSSGSLTAPDGAQPSFAGMGVSCVGCSLPFGLCGQTRSAQCEPPDSGEPTCSSSSSADLAFFFSLKYYS